MGYNTETQKKNLAWYLPRPKTDRYKGGMPLYCEDWLLELAGELMGDEEIKLLNLFCGMNKHGFRVDINPEVNPDLLADAHEVSAHISERFNVILADPPYSNEEAKELYGTPPLKYKKWTAEADKLLAPGGLFIVYHKYVMPNPDPEKYFVEKRVFIGSRIYHVPRIAIYFRKKNLAKRLGSGEKDD